MKILTYTSLFPNQVQPEHGIFIYRRMSAFASRRGNSITVVAPVPYFPEWLPGKSHWKDFARVPWRERVGALDVFHPRYLLVPSIGMAAHGVLMYLGGISLMRQLYREQRFDCIDAHYVYPDGLAAAIAGKTLGIPVIISARGTDINVFPNFASIRPMIRWTLRRVAGAIAVCGPLQERMLQLGLDQGRSRVIGNGVDIELFFPVQRNQARARLGIREEGRLLVAVGGLVPGKGFQNLIPAVARIAHNFPDLRLYIIGEGRNRRKLEEIIARERLGEKVKLVGARPNAELKYWFSAANITCLPSLREGWPNVLLESMACGTPVVASNVGGVPDIVVSPALGLMMQPNVDSIAATLEAAFTRSWDHQAISEYARNRTWNDVAAEVEEFFCSVLCRTDQA